MNEGFLRALGFLLGLGALLADIWFSLDLLSAKSDFWWLGIPAIFVGLWLFVLLTRWIFKPKKQ